MKEAKIPFGLTWRIFIRGFFYGMDPTTWLVPGARHQANLRAIRNAEIAWEKRNRK